MVYIPNENEWEPAMRYEGLARYSYNCARAGDPEGIADASVFDRHFIPVITEGMRIMNGILSQLIQKSTGDMRQALIDVKESLTTELK